MAASKVEYLLGLRNNRDSGTATLVHFSERGSTLYITFYILILIF